MPPKIWPVIMPGIETMPMTFMAFCNTSSRDQHAWQRRESPARACLEPCALRTPAMNIMGHR